MHIKSSVVLGMIAMFGSIALFAIEPGRVPSVTVVGKVRIEIPAEYVQMTVSIGGRAKDLDTARKDLEAASEKVLAFVRAFGLANADIAVLNTMTTKKYGREDSSLDVTAYEATRVFALTLRDVPRYLDFSSGLMKNGVMQVLPPRLGSTQEPKAREQAYVEAMKAARDKAELLAKEAGAKLGKAILIDAHDSDYESLNYFISNSSSASGTSAIDMKKVQVGAEVQVTYALEWP